MSLKHKFVVALCGAVLTPLLALCQENAPSRSEVSVEGFLPIVESTTASGVQQTTSENGPYSLVIASSSGRIAALRSAMATREAHKRIT